MARKNTLLDALITLPWWFNLTLAAVVYVFLKYWLPTVQFKQPLFQGMVSALPNMAHIISIMLIVIAAISAFHSWRKGELLERQVSVKSIKKLSWKEFEYLVSEAYKRKGFSVSENLGSGSDGGVDVVLEKDDEKILVQCKNWRSTKVGVTVVRELLGVVTAESASKGIIVCSGDYTKDAVDFANNNNIELVTGESLAILIASVQKKQSRHVKRNSYDCPKFGCHMVQRTAKKGPNTGTRFLGCSRFPKCRGIRKD